MAIAPAQPLTQPAAAKQAVIGHNGGPPLDDGHDRFIGDAEQKRITNLSRTTRWRLERAGKFPKTYKISTNRKARLLSEVTAWMRAKRGEAD